MGIECKKIGRWQLLNACNMSFHHRDRVRYFKLILAFKIHSGVAPKYLSESFLRFSSIHHYNTRRSQTDYMVSREDTASSIVMEGFTYTSKREWNMLPVGLKVIPKLNVLKEKLREYLMKPY